MRVLLLLLIVFIASCSSKKKKERPLSRIQVYTKEQQEIIDETFKNAAPYNLNSREYQEELDKGLKKDSTISYLWQQRAMPLFKQGKYEAGMPFLDKAVEYSAEKYLDYRAFMKCIFAKNYKDAIQDFEIYKKEFGRGYVMDHTYEFYIGLSYLQLNKFKKAESILMKEIETVKEKEGIDSVHYLDLFYYGISKFEQRKYVDAIKIFDQALTLYSTFSDVLFYKALSLAKTDNIEEARKVMDMAILNAELGNTINEDNVIYERYPYQVRLRTYEIYK